MKVVAGRGPYFAQIPFALLDDPQSSAAHIATYCALRRFTDFGSPKGCFASHKKLAQVAGLSVAAVKRALLWLRDKQWVEWTTKPSGRSNQYTVHNAIAQSELTDRSPVSDQIAQPEPLPRDKELETVTERQKDSTPAAWVRLFAHDWTNLYGGIPSHGEIGKRLKPLIDAHGFEPVRERWQRYLEATEGRYASPTRFAQTYGSWDRPGGAPAQEGYVSIDEARVAFRAAGIPDSWPVNPDGYESRAMLAVAIAVRREKLNTQPVP
jgi:hypothetical protein